MTDAEENAIVDYLDSPFIRSIIDRIYGEAYEKGFSDGRDSERRLAKPTLSLTADSLALLRQLLIDSPPTTPTTMTASPQPDTPVAVPPVPSAEPRSPYAFSHLLKSVDDSGK